MSARDEVLARVRRALADVPAGEAPAWAPDDPSPRDAASPGSALELLDRFCERVGDYRANVVRVTGDHGAVGSAVLQVAARHGAVRIAVPGDLPAAWLCAAIEPVWERPGAPLDAAVLDQVDGVITGCATAIAETGTIVLDAGIAQGPRALTLVPDLHICVVFAEQIVSSVAEAVGEIGATVRTHRRPVTFISGPSATSDIELDRVEGVHGPRRLEVIVVER